MERKKREEAEKKKKAEERKTQSVPAKGVAGKKGGKDDGDEDDPIAKSLNQRIAAGGLTQVIAKAPGEKPTMGKAATVATAVGKLKQPIKKGDEEEKSTDKTATDAKKSVPKVGGSTSNLVKKVSKVDDISDDPIA